MPQRHSTDEELIAKLDGELGLLASSFVHQHLQACWQCRARMRELEDQALRIARAVSNDTFPGPDRVAFAIRRFSAWRASARRAESSSRRCGNSRRFVASAALAGALGLALASIVAIRLRQPDPPATPALAAPVEAVALFAQRVEQAWIDQPCHETLRVEITNAASERPIRSHLELWSDRSSLRYAVEWRDAAGRLRAANSMTGPSASTAEHSPLISFDGVELTGSDQDLRRLEEQLFRYVNTQPLRLVSLSGTFVEFAGSNGLTVRVEKAQSPAGALRLLASRQSHGITADLILELDAVALRAKALFLRLHDAHHSLQAAFVVETFETLPRGQLKLAAFEPKQDRLAIRASALSTPMEPETPATLDQDFTEKEIDIHYALHRVRACLGDPIRVERLQPGRIVVRGLVDSDAQKEKILSMLRDFGGVEARITTMAEAVQERQASTVDSLHSKPVSLTIGNASFPMREKLQAYLPGLADPRERAREIARLSDQVVSLSGSALAEAWAIHRLGQTFPAGHPDPLGLIEQMVADHAAAFRGRAEQLRVLLQPWLPPSPPASPLAAPNPLTAAQSIDELVRSMFSGSQAPEASLDSGLQRLAGLLATTNTIDFTERKP